MKRIWERNKEYLWASKDYSISMDNFHCTLNFELKFVKLRNVVKTHYPSEIILHRGKCHEILTDLPSTYPQALPPSIHINCACSCQLLPQFGGLLTSCNNLLQQADIRMRSHGLRQLVTTSLLQVFKRLVASCQQTCCKLINSTGLFHLVSTSCTKSVNDKLRQAWS